MRKEFEAEFTKQALEQLKQLTDTDARKILKAINIFEQVGTKYKYINDLGNGLFELKPDKVRAYFKYAKNKIIIIGLIVLKKTQKAPSRYIEQAHKNIDKYIKENMELQI
jgi:phage-related protein